MILGDRARGLWLLRRCAINEAIGSFSIVAGDDPSDRRQL
jgi:hypothetical protein